MTASLKDIQSVLDGKSVPEQKNYGGLEHLPDVDFNVRQHEPLLVLSQGKIYRRQHPSKINIISPSEYDKIRENPTENGYVEVSNKWSAFGLVCKLRLFAHFYDGKVQPVSEEKKNQIKSEEKIRSPHRRKIPKSSCKLEENPTVLDWRQRTDSMSSLDGLKEHGLLHHKKHKKRKHHHRPKEPELHLEKNIQTYARMKN